MEADRQSVPQTWSGDSERTSTCSFIVFAYMVGKVYGLMAPEVILCAMCEIYIMSVSYCTDGHE